MKPDEIQNIEEVGTKVNEAVQLLTTCVGEIVRHTQDYLGENDMLETYNCPNCKMGFTKIEYDIPPKNYDDWIEEQPQQLPEEDEGPPEDPELPENENAPPPPRIDV